MYWRPDPGAELARLNPDARIDQQSCVVAVDAGVHTIEHCSWMAGAGQYDRREDTARKMAAAGIFACAALSQNWRALYERLGLSGDRRHSDG